MFQDQYPETRKHMMKLHAKRAADYEYLKPGQEPTPFDWTSARSHTVYEAVKQNPPIETMRMVLIDGKWRLKV